MRALIDTCVIVDALQSRTPFCKAAEGVFLAAANRRFDGFLSAKSVADIYYLTHRATHSDGETRKLLGKLFTLFDLLDTTGMDCRRALSSDIADYEDAVMAESALRGEIDCIVTRNLKDYRASPVRTVSPEAFLESIAIVPEE